MSPRVYSFKSSGETPQRVRDRLNQQVVEPPVGIKTPLELGQGDDGLLKMTRSVEEAIADNLRNLLLTNRGERLMDYQFGADLKELTFELGDEDFDAEAINRINSAVGRYLPFVNLLTFEPFRDGAEDSVARIGFRITYSVPIINETERKLEVILYAVG